MVEVVTLPDKCQAWVLSITRDMQMWAVKVVSGLNPQVFGINNKA